jgi:hypothetical protein
MSRDTAADVAAILHPIPDHPSGYDIDDELFKEGFDEWRDEVLAERQQAEEALRASWDGGDQDPVLSALSAARRAKEEAEEQIRHLIAYGREFVQPRPYTLGDLAAAAGMSVSGTRTSYSHTDVDAVAAATGAKSREWRATDPADAPAPDAAQATP